MSFKQSKFVLGVFLSLCSIFEGRVYKLLVKRAACIFIHAVLSNHFARRALAAFEIGARPNVSEIYEDALSKVFILTPVETPMPSSM